MKTMAISEFKAHALKVLNEVAKSQESIVIAFGKREDWHFLQPGRVNQYRFGNAETQTC